MPRPRLDVEQFAPRITPKIFVLLIELAEELGVAPQRLCSGLGCSVEDFRRGEQISHLQAWRIVRRALRLTGRADLGFELGTRQNLSHFGVPGLAMGSARTLSAAGDISVRYQDQSRTISAWSLEQAGEFVAVIVTSNLRDQTVLPFVVEEHYTSGVGITRLLVGDDFHLERLELAYPEPAHAERYREFFRCPVYFDCARNRALLERKWLSAPIATHSTVTAAKMRELLEQEAQAKPLPSPTAAVEQILLRSGNARLSIEQVAGALQLSVRTLRRRLREDGSSFRAMCERIQVETAQRLLREQGMTVTAVAKQLGFSDARTFRRAFKRWLGQVPGDLRKSAGERAACDEAGGSPMAIRTRTASAAGHGE